jgi:hypothetical protein
MPRPVFLAMSKVQHRDGESEPLVAVYLLLSHIFRPFKLTLQITFECHVLSGACKIGYGKLKNPHPADITRVAPYFSYSPTSRV